MKIGKIFVLISIILLVSGCHAEYNININKDLTISEEIKVLEKNKTISSLTPAPKYYVEDMISQYKDTNTDDDHYILSKIGKTKSGAVATKIYDNFDTFQSTSYLKNRVFESMTMDYSNDLVLINLTPINKQFDVFNSSDTKGSLLDGITLNIQVPYKVTSNNADKIDVINNIYTWNYNANTIYKKVSLVFNKNQIYKVSIADKINVYYQEGRFTIPIIIASTILIAMVIVGLVMKRDNKINKI